jgi:hypothetical protein
MAWKCNKLNKIKSNIVLLIILFSCYTYAQENLKIDSNGLKLQNYYLSLNVEHLWLSGWRIIWETGERDPLNILGKTHCSAFAAASCTRLNIYILRPPDHSETLLANAQFDWLETTEAKDNGWHQINYPDPYKIYSTAQDMANKGYIVAISCKNPDPTESGHIALVMPGEISNTGLMIDGPLVIMAGTNNYNSTPMKNGFSKHIISWPETSFVFYYNKNINEETGVNNKPDNIPERFLLNQNYPNPFNPETKIRFQVPFVSNVNISIYNINGEKLSTIVNETLTTGSYEKVFPYLKLRNNYAGGVYFCVLRAGNSTITRKMILEK